MLFAPDGLNNPTQISNVQVFEITSSSVTLTWDTDLNSSSQVEVTKVDTGEVTYTTLDESGAYNHVVVVNGLESNTLYDLRAISESLGGQPTPTYSAPARVRTRR